MKISQPELLTALEDKEAFYSLYVGLTNRAIDLYAKAGRGKFALKLHGCLAALDVYVIQTLCQSQLISIVPT